MCEKLYIIIHAEVIAFIKLTAINESRIRGNELKSTGGANVSDRGEISLIMRISYQRKTRVNA